MDWPTVARNGLGLKANSCIVIAPASRWSSLVPHDPKATATTTTRTRPNGRRPAASMENLQRSEERRVAPGPTTLRRRLAREPLLPPRHRLVAPPVVGASAGAIGNEHQSVVMADSLRQASDAAVVVAIGRWRQDALAEAYRRHAGAVFALSRRLLIDPGMAEEVVQEVFLRLWNQPEKFDPERGSLRAFLLAQTHGRSVDVLRAETSRRRREERDARQTAESGYDIEREVMDLSMADQVNEVMATLPIDERRAIELAYFGGHTYRQVAVMLDQPEGTVKSRIRSGLRRMRDQLSDAGVSGAWTES
ncbi:MAG: sigma-70 family RNA polymerase sigma factor [Actinobacteria bacterium]|nr:MAG: sigma-70 family RNA polymerase sigma factor [Actinomycetota bacterium]